MSSAKFNQPYRHVMGDNLHKLYKKYKWNDEEIKKLDGATKKWSDVNEAMKKLR
jgi:hypothetical protein